MNFVGLIDRNKKYQPMKILFTIITSIIALTITAQANSSNSKSSQSDQNSYIYISGYDKYGKANYVKRVTVGYDSYGKAIYRYYSIPSVVSYNKGYSKI